MASEQYSMLMLDLGKVAGRLSFESVQAELVESLRTGRLHPDYVRFVRDHLTQALKEAGHEQA